MTDKTDCTVLGIDVQCNLTIVAIDEFRQWRCTFTTWVFATQSIHTRPCGSNISCQQGENTQYTNAQLHPMNAGPITTSANALPANPPVAAATAEV